MADGNNEDEWDTDEDDEEYVPPDGEVSDEDISDQSDDEPENENEEDASLANPGHKRKTKTKKVKKKRRLEPNKDEETETKEPKPMGEDEKKKIDSLWADFLSDPTVKSITPTKKDTSVSQNIVVKKPEEETAKDKPQAPGKSKKVTVTELFEFAGETVEVQKEVDAASIQANKAIGISGTSKTISEVATKPAAASGIGNLLQQIGAKKNKLSVLEKTKIDWNTFKKEEGIEEDLKIHNKGKDGYLAKMEFLERTDLRQFEIEKRIRSINRTRKS